MAGLLIQAPSFQRFGAAPVPRNAPSAARPAIRSVVVAADRKPSWKLDTPSRLWELDEVWYEIWRAHLPVLGWHDMLFLGCVSLSAFSSPLACMMSF